MARKLSRKHLVGLALVLAGVIIVTWYIDWQKASSKPYFTQSPPFEAPKREVVFTEHAMHRVELEKLLKHGLTEEEALERFGPNKPLELQEGVHRLYSYAYPPAVIERLADESPQNYGIGILLEFANGCLINAFEARTVVRNHFLDGETLLRELSLGDSPETVVALLGEPSAMSHEKGQIGFFYHFKPEISEDFPIEYAEATLVIDFLDDRLVSSEYCFTPKNAPETTSPIAELLARRTCHLHGEDSDGSPRWEEPLIPVP